MTTQDCDNAANEKNYHEDIRIVTNNILEDFLQKHANKNVQR